jgi:vacuolar-type H+-ATPase catalytic subunit A/Vma1
MSPAVFEVILTHVANYLEFQKRSEENYGGQAQLNVEKTLLIAIWTLATPESYRSVSDSFNVGKSTVSDSVHRVVDVVVNHLCQIFIKWPVIENRQNVALELARYGLPNVIETIDRCHIPIKKKQG